MDALIQALETSQRRRPAALVLLFGFTASFVFLMVQYYWFGARFLPQWHENINIFLAPLLIALLTIILSFIVAFSQRSVATRKINHITKAPSSPLPIHAAEPLETFFETSELDKLKLAYQDVEDQNQLTLIGFLSLSAPMDRLERSYHLGQVLFLHLCLKLIDTCNYKVQLRINPYGEWPEKDRNSSRNAKYLAATLVWSLATEFKLLPRPLVSEDLTNDEYRQARIVQDALSEFRTEFVGSGVSRMPNRPGHKVYYSLLAWRLDPSVGVDSHIKNVVQLVQKFYRDRHIDLSDADVLAIFYLFLYKFSSTDQEEIAKATISYIKLGENSIFLECEKNRYYLSAHAALAKIAGLKFPAMIYFKGVPSLGLNAASKYMKGGSKVMESQLLSLEDLCGDDWKKKISSYLHNSQNELCSLFGIECRTDTSSFDMLIDDIAKRLRSSVLRAKQIYSSHG